PPHHRPAGATLRRLRGLEAARRTGGAAPRREPLSALRADALGGERRRHGPLASWQSARRHRQSLGQVDGVVLGYPRPLDRGRMEASTARAADNSPALLPTVFGSWPN